MGWWYNHVTLKGPTQDDIATALHGEEFAAELSPTVRGITIAYVQKARSGLGQSLSGRFRCPSLEVQIEDSDVMHYWLHDSGVLVDKYDSRPGYYGDEPQNDVPKPEDDVPEDNRDFRYPKPIGGSADLLCSIFDAQDRIIDVEAVLRHINYWPANAASSPWEPQERHERLVTALGLPVFSADMMFWSMDRLSEFVYTGDIADQGNVSAYAITGLEQPRPALFTWWEIVHEDGVNSIRRRSG